MGDSAATLLGTSPTASDALSALGGDLTLSISFAVAHELLDAARDAELGEAELIGIVLSTSIVLSALPNVLWLARTEVVVAYGTWLYNSGKTTVRPMTRPNPNDGEVSGLLAFLALFVRVAQRISMSICVQLIAANVQVQQPLRVVRVITLLGVAVFFVFLESTATVGRVQRRQ
jgi:hypothetical protein